MKKILLWFLAFIITIVAALYQRKTGPTYPKRISVEINDSIYDLKLVRSLGLDERPEVRIRVYDTTVKAVLYYKRFKTNDAYTSVPFIYREYPVNSFVMNKIFGINEEKGLYAQIPQQAPAGKIEYYLEISDSQRSITLPEDNPVIIRFKGAVPSSVLTPHILIMFLAMLLSTVSGLFALAGIASFRHLGIWTLILLTAGGMILGPVVQKYAFGSFWTGVPLGWDLTDNKTLIAFLFWIMAVILNRKHHRPLFTVLASVILLIVYSVPHSLFGSEMDYSTGNIIQGFILFFFIIKQKNLNLMQH
ncbi:MAG: hypothetical protein JXR66_04115 [Bacteroidales bacterium]|nr:hypothetical protein [Bacteroidales bacterium]MBN2632718.1 hypothetical protein [Bacteroidales bacterium]